MTAGPPPVTPTSPHPNERGAAWLLCGAVGCGTLLRCLGRWHWLFELTTHFAVQAATLAALAALLLAIRRHGRLAAVTLGLALLNVIDLWPLYRPVDTIPVGATTPLTVVASNVLSSNHHSDTLRDWLDKEQADVVFLCEPDDWWGFEVARWSQRWPHQYVKTRADNFGVGILSRYPLIEPQVIPLAHNNPALLCQIEAHGTRWTILGLHPFPPSGRRLAWGRNAQLQDAARLIGTLRGPLIVAGDFNVTSSSPYFQDLLLATGLTDTRLGRGLQPSWPADNPFLRIPIDHVLISPEVQLHDRRLGPAIGSDHLPVIVRVSVAPATPTPSEYTMLGDLKDARWIIAKGFLFLLCGVMAGTLLWLDTPTLRTVVLLGLSVWCFCRFYYFAFYVIEHYVDDTFRYAGLWSALRYLWSRNSRT